MEKRCDQNSSLSCQRFRKSAVISQKMAELLILHRRLCWCPAADVIVFSSGKSPETITTIKGNLHCRY